MDTDTGSVQPELMDIEAVQKVLNRSRASIYRYANTDPKDLNPTYDPQRLNPELRFNASDPLRFHPNEVARFARDILGVQQVTIEVQESAQSATLEVLRLILVELKSIRQLLQSQSQSEL